MEKLNISQCLATPQNEDWLRMAFCCQFEECHPGKGEIPDINFFVRLNFDCRNGELFVDVYHVEEFAYKQLTQRHGLEESIHFIAVFSVWVNSTAPTLYGWETTDLFPSERLEAARWKKWRADAEAFIQAEYERYPLDDLHSDFAWQTIEPMF